MPKWLKTTLLASGGAFLLVVLLAVLFAVFIGMPLDKESRNAAEKIVLATGAQWNPEVLRASADKTMLKATSPEKMDALLAVFRRRLGAVKSLSSPVGSSASFWDIAEMTPRVTARWRFQVVFEKGPGSATVDLVKRNGGWLLQGLNVNSDLLLN